MHVGGTYPLDHCGVGDYLSRLVVEMATDASTRVAVVCGNPAPLSGGEGIDYFPTDGLLDAARVREAVEEWQPDVVHVQYPTARAISSRIPLALRRAGICTVQTWHEYFEGNTQLSWKNLLGVDGLVYVRPDLWERLPGYVRLALSRIPRAHIPNASVIPVVRLPDLQRVLVRDAVSRGRELVTFFGFMHPNKGVDRLFEIADPARHHLLFIGALDPDYAYHRTLLAHARTPPWRDHVTFTGHIEPNEVGRLLTASDAVVFPFLEGVGDWNTSVDAALGSGSLVLATSATVQRITDAGDRNLVLLPCDQWRSLRSALQDRLSRRVEPRRTSGWPAIVQRHLDLYAKALKGR